MLQRVFAEWLMAHPKEEVYRRAQSGGLAAAYVADANDVVNSEHLRARDYFETTNLNDGRGSTCRHDPTGPSGWAGRTGRRQRWASTHATSL